MLPDRPPAGDRGKRHAFLPFLYDEAARQQRMAYLVSTAEKPASPG
jgi:hypothetical protein